ncbi:hypothetical protein BofuT4_uP081000.1 [Botrytis cinerea T4]|uniref:Uncharacterized protein n=1 Tax=Botryotinia fuckeliana (strain T4) TaxID=999810 RepID=G2YL07_BOTF4|nr:hypothetical protein BofuT4_uP081000.1 [Botrytis cinerea T4]
MGIRKMLQPQQTIACRSFYSLESRFPNLNSPRSLASIADGRSVSSGLAFEDSL